MKKTTKRIVIGVAAFVAVICGLSSLVVTKENEYTPESVKFILFCNQLSKQNWLSIALIAVFFQFPH